MKVDKFLVAKYLHFPVHYPNPHVDAGYSEDEKEAAKKMAIETVHSYEESLSLIRELAFYAYPRVITDTEELMKALLTSGN